jgi:protein-disulfide isomerase
VSDQPTNPPPAEETDSADEALLTIPHNTFNYLIVGAVFLVLGILIGVVVANQQSGGVNAATRAVIQESVDAAMAAQADIIADAVAQARPPDLEDPDSRFNVSAAEDPFLGAADATVEIIEFSDFNCGFCARWAEDTLTPIIENYGDRVRIYYRDYPILAETSLTAALAAQCAHDQGQFWEYHNILFANQGQFGNEQLVSYAEELGLDTATFNTCLTEQTHFDGVAADYQTAQQLGIRGTPAFFINGRPISGAQPYEVFAQMIEEELAAAAES